MKKTKKSSLIIKILIIFFMILIIPNLIDVLNVEFDTKKYNPISTPPVLYIETDGGKKVELVLVSYTLNLDNKTEEVTLVDDMYAYEFEEKNKLISFDRDLYEIKTDENVNLENFEYEVLDANDKTKFLESSNGSIEGNSCGKLAQNVAGEYLNIFRVYTTDKSFYGTYIYKELVVGMNALYTNETENLELDNKDAMKKIINYVPYAKLLNYFEIEDKTLILEYDVQFSDEDLERIAKSILVCIDGIENVKIIVNDKSTTNALYLEWESYEYKALPKKEYIVNINDFKDDEVSIENAKEYLEK